MAILRGSEEPNRRVGEAFALRSDDAYRLQLARGGRFTPPQLAAQIAAHPNLAYCSPNRAEYVIGGYWRQRSEIGLILELVCATACGDLLASLVEAYHSGGAKLVVVDPREQERSDAVYSANGFTVVQTLIQLEWHGSRVTGSRQRAGTRPMREKDVAAVLDVEQHAFPWLWWNSDAELRWYATIPGVELYVVTANEPTDLGRVAGYAGFTVFEGHGHLDRLAVHRDYQGKGYGRALLAFAIERMSKAGIRRVALTTQLDNVRSQALYRGFGFKESGWQHQMLGLWLRPAGSGEAT